MELYQEKDEWLVSELTAEEKISDEYDYDDVIFVPIEGNHITLSL